MQNHLQPVLVPQPGELSEIRKDELVEHGRTHQQVQLGPEIIAKEKPIHPVTRQLEETGVRLQVEIHHMPGHRMHHFRVGIHFDKVILHAEEIRHFMEERAPEPAGPVGLACLVKFGKGRREIEVFQIRPFKGIDLRHGITVGKYAGGSMTRAFPAHVEHRLPVGMPVGVPGRHPPEIIPQPGAKFIRRGGAEIPVQDRPCFLVRASQPEPATVSGLFGNDCL